jgi:glycosyltransferase involved in cell wall biosynthesis
MAASVSVVFPMYNEEAYIRRAVDAVVDALHEEHPDFEIVIVDDASTDRTGAIADELAGRDPRVRVVHNARNLTLGGALKAGYAAATKEFIFYTDADLPVDLRQVPRAIRLLEYQQADVMAAYRFDRTSEGLVRAVYTFFYNQLIRALFPMKVRDVNFAFKVFRRRVLEAVTLRSEGSFVDAEFLVRAHKAGFHIIQIGLDYFPRTRGTSTLASVAVIFRILAELARLWPELRGPRRAREWTPPPGR